MTTLEIIVDGGCRGNGTDNAQMYGSAFVNADQGVWKTWEFGLGTNNRAEYLSLIESLKYVAEFHCRDIVIKTDSELVRNQISGQWKIKEPSLRPLVFEARTLLEMFNSWKIVHISGVDMKAILGH